MKLIFNKLKLFHGLTTDLELANLLNLNQSALSMKKKRGSIDINAILSVSEEIDLNWLLKSQYDSTGSVEHAQYGTSESKEFFKADENDLIQEILRLRKKLSEMESKKDNS